MRVHIDIDQLGSPGHVLWQGGEPQDIVVHTVQVPAPKSRVREGVVHPVGVKVPVHVPALNAHVDPLLAGI